MTQLRAYRVEKLNDGYTVQIVNSGMTAMFSEPPKFIAKTFDEVIKIIKNNAL